MVAGAVVGACHLAVAGVKVAAVADRVAVHRVRAEKVRGARIHKRNVDIVRLVRVRQPAVDRLKVLYHGVGKT